ncbi:hypothetical protein CGZ93_08430 [Enemella dayhoffiae]|uniref:Uncharacterized protein n=1 Tax=Enemella dayhoffiae TaxID=2016507 RepID=A0A255H3F8_9ACTN|nr:hypothetical protein CGZ93_08430 [Enemella dayhoffiae]
MPSDAHDQKVRVCRYRVQEIAPLAAYATLSISFDDDTNDEDEFEDAEDDVYGDSGSLAAGSWRTYPRSGK